MSRNQVLGLAALSAVPGHGFTVGKPRDVHQAEISQVAKDTNVVGGYERARRGVGFKPIGGPDVVELKTGFVTRIVVS
jgi:hypothetical protein